MPMQRPKPWESYRKVATQTASPAHLVLMLYDGAIGFLERALAGFDVHRSPASSTSPSIITFCAPRPSSTR